MNPKQVTGGNVEDGSASSVMRKVKTTPGIYMLLLGIAIILASSIFTSVVIANQGIGVSSLPTEPWQAPVSQNVSSWRLLLNSLSLSMLSFAVCMKIFSLKVAKKIMLTIAGIMVTALLILSFTPLFSFTSLFNSHEESTEANFTNWAEQRYGIVLENITSVSHGSIIKDSAGNEYRIYTGNEGTLLYDTEITHEIPLKSEVS